jgi:integrase
MSAIRDVRATLPFAEAIMSGISYSDCGESHRKNQLDAGAKLIAFVNEKFGTLEWSEFKGRHVRHYVDYLRGQQRSPSTILNAVNPVRLAMKFAAIEHDRPRFEMPELPHPSEPVKTWLDLPRVANLYRVAKAEEWHDAAISTLLQSLAALRLTEAIRAEPEDLRLTPEGPELWIGCREAKNRTSVRILPIPALLAERLREYWSEGRALSPLRNSVGAQVRRALRSAARDAEDPKEDALYRATDPKDLRKTLPNTLIESAGETLLKVYLGHAPKGMMQMHYLAMTPKPNDTAIVRAKSIAALREKIVEPWEKMIAMYDFS